MKRTVIRSATLAAGLGIWLSTLGIEMGSNGTYNSVSLSGSLSRPQAAQESQTNSEPSSDRYQFTDIAANSGTGIDYRRTPDRHRKAVLAELEKGEYTLPSAVENPFDSDFFASPLKYAGAPGVAIFDYDNDGDEDIYVTNGPESANSLYQNRFTQTGRVKFRDVGKRAGVGAIGQDSSGTCYGDIDNDGDSDLLVLGINGQGQPAERLPNQLFENNGRGKFKNITGKNGSEIAGGNFNSATCSFGDVNGDGLLDVAVSNTYRNWDRHDPIIGVPYAENEHNQLFVNQGGNIFTEEGAGRGFQNTSGFSPPNDGAAGITWAISLVDLDQDNDLDAVFADDQAAFPPEAAGGLDRGILHYLENDGDGNFRDVTLYKLGAKQGAWMGLSFADYDCNGHIDMFATNMGDYFPAGMLGSDNYPQNSASTRWFLQNSDGTFEDTGVGNDLVVTPFGWGTASIDSDNDGDSDIIFHGGIYLFFLTDTSNFGVMLENQDCDGTFKLNRQGTSSTDHKRRNVQGLATGDLNKDGFTDVVTVSNINAPSDAPVVPYLTSQGTPLAYGSPFDEAGFVPVATPINSEGTIFSFENAIEFEQGTLAVEINKGNRNKWIKVEAIGTKAIVENARVNRDGIGARVSVTPQGVQMKTNMMQVLSGGTYASDHSRTINFGLGNKNRATIEVAWPSGTTFKMYEVKKGKTVRVPELPCSVHDFEREEKYQQCVSKTLDAIDKHDKNTRIRRNRINLGQAEKRDILESASTYWDEVHN